MDDSTAAAIGRVRSDAVEGSSVFEDLYEREYRAVVGLVYALSGSRWAAEDIAQEALLRAHKHWATVGSSPRPEAWVRKVAVNLAISRFRRLRSEARALARWAGSRSVSFPPLEPASDDFWALVRALPRRQAQVVALHYVEDLSVQRIAEMLGVAESTVKTSLQRGRATLARRIGDEPGGER